MVNENLSTMAFSGLQLESVVPNHSCFSRFRRKLAENGSFDALLAKINKQLETYEVLVKKGIETEASLTDSIHIPRKRLPTK